MPTGELVESVTTDHDDDQLHVAPSLRRLVDQVQRTGQADETLSHRLGAKQPHEVVQLDVGVAWGELAQSAVGLLHERVGLAPIAEEVLSPTGVSDRDPVGHHRLLSEVLLNGTQQLDDVVEELPIAWAQPLHEGHGEVGDDAGTKLPAVRQQQRHEQDVLRQVQLSLEPQDDAQHLVGLGLLVVDFGAHRSFFVRRSCCLQPASVQVVLGLLHEEVELECVHDTPRCSSGRERAYIIPTKTAIVKLPRVRAVL